MISGGSRRHAGRAGRVEDQPLLEQRAPHELGRPSPVELEREHQPAAAHAATPGSSASSARSRSPSSRTRSQQLRVVEHVERRERRGRDHRPAGERRAVVAGLRRRRRAAAPVTSAPIGRPPPSALAVVIASGTTRVVLVRPQRPGPPQAGLDLVEDQRGAVARRTPRARRAARPRARVHAAPRPGSARAAPRRCRSPTASAIALRRRRTASKPGTSGANGACLASCGVADSAPYVRPWKRPATTTISPPGWRLAGELQRRLVRLRAAVGEEHAAAERALGQPLGQPHHRRGEVEVADVQQRSGLLADRPTTARVAVADARHADAGRKSRYSVPSASHSRAPSPRTNSTG